MNLVYNTDIDSVTTTLLRDLKPGDLFTTVSELVKAVRESSKPTIWMVGAKASGQTRFANGIPTVSLRRGAVGSSKAGGMEVRQVFGYFVITGIEGVSDSKKPGDDLPNEAPAPVSAVPDVP